MATALTPVERKRVRAALWQLYKRTVSDTGKGPIRGVGPRITGDDAKQYREYVIQLKQSKVWLNHKRLSHEIGAMNKKHDIFCEHCLRGNRMVHLMLPALVSRHKFGDWVCADCDEIAAEQIISWELEHLVVGAEE